jgi:hypothetical protein
MVVVIALVVILVAVNVVFLMQWRSADSERADVEARLKVAEVNLTNARVQYDVVELRQQEAELSRNPDFPTTLPVVGLSLFLAEGALLSQVELDKVEPPERVGTETIGGKSYPAYATKVTATSSLTKIVSFLKYIEGGAFSSIRVEDLQVKRDGALWTGVFTVVVISQT